MTTIPFCSEELLYRKVASGDLDALGVLYEKNKKMVYCKCLGMTKDPSLASDLTQDCFVALWEGRHHILSAENAAAYFSGLCRNVVLKCITTHKNRRRIAQHAADQLPKAVNPYQEIIENETHKALQAGVARLTPQRKEVVHKKQLKLTNREIADIMNISEETVKSHFSNALSDLRKILTPLGG